MVQLYDLLLCRLAGGRQPSCKAPELQAIIFRYLVHEKIFTKQALLFATGSAAPAAPGGGA
jgi:hypothetical protein